MLLHYTPGSPFSRMVRVILRERAIACEETAIEVFPPPPDYFDINPLGQVPALETEDGVRFPTRLIIDYLLALPPCGRASNADLRAPGSWQEEQTLVVTLAMGDALAAVKYQQWAGLRPAVENLIGYDPADRGAERVHRTLDWLERQRIDGDRVGVHQIAIACLLLWTDARGGFPWRGRPHLEAIVAHCANRASFLQTTPQPWP